MSVASCYVAGELLCRRRAVWQWRAVRRWAVVGCLGGAWHFMVLAQMSQWPTAPGSRRWTKCYLFPFSGNYLAAKGQQLQGHIHELKSTSLRRSILKGQ